MTNQLRLLCAVLGLSCAANIALGAVPAEKAAQLRSILTPLGGERAGNAAGSIPEWTGGISAPVPGYQHGDHHPDPYAADMPLFEINAANLGQYAERVPLGLQQLLKQNPDYRMRVFPTHRSAAVPQRIYDATFENATRAELVSHGNGIQGAVSGTPFPIPQSGLEVIWNHILRYRGESVNISSGMFAVLPDGARRLQKGLLSLYFVYGREGVSTGELDNALFYYKHRLVEPASSAGTALVLAEPLDQSVSMRKAWRYDPGSRRVITLPKLTYDTVQPDTNGLGRADTLDVYNGAPDKYTWALVGKQEMYVPYNSYQVHQRGLPYEQVVLKQHLNDSLLRYELHRVWVIEASLRQGHRHVYGKRRFYLDEDSWQILATDLYGSDGQQLTRAQEVHPINYYEMPLITSTLEVTYNFEDGSFLVDGLDNNESMYDFQADLSPRGFSSSALRREGR